MDRTSCSCGKDKPYGRDHCNQCIRTAKIDAVLVEASTKDLKKWAERQKMELRMTKGATINEANLAVNKTITNWGRSLGSDQHFNEELVRVERENNANKNNVNH